MTLTELKSQIALGEDSRRQFKRGVTNADSLAAEMAAFANCDGGAIFLGVADDGSLPGLSRADVKRINQLIGNAASQHVRSPLTVQTENVAVGEGRIIIVLTVPKGQDRPYFDRNGVIWLKSGADKRRVNSKEELRRLFQSVDQFHADELPTKAGIDKLDKLRFRDFLRDVYQQEYPDAPAERLRLLQNLNLATDDGKLNLAGVLLFAEQPERIKPQFVLKAIRYPGNDIHSTLYLDTEDFSGPLRKVFDDSLAFIMRNLHKVQAGRGVNAPGTPEIPPTVFEELLVNALVHRDYLVSAPIRLFIFDNRIEIISPGHLPNNLTVEKIRAGNSVIRNPVLVSYVAKGLLPYHGLGSGIKRALEDWPEIDFTDDRDGLLFTATIHRKEREVSEKTAGVVDESSLKSSPISSPISSGKKESSPKTENQIIELIKQDAPVSTKHLGEILDISKRAVLKQIKKLKDQGRLKRVGPAKGGHWEVIE
jgi:ATP-dependent DNA helicase RecG